MRILRSRRLIPAGIAFLLALFVLLAWREGCPPETPSITQAEAASALERVRSALEGRSVPTGTQDFDDSSVRTVFLQLGRDWWFRGTGADSRTSFANLLTLVRVFAATNTNRYDEALLIFVGEEKELLAGGLLFWSLTVQQGLDGISMVSEDGRRAWLLPEEGGNEQWAGGEPFGFIPFRFGLSRTKIAAGLTSALDGRAQALGRLPRLVASRARPLAKARLSRFRTSTWYARLDQAVLPSHAISLYRNTVLPTGYPLASDITNAMHAAAEWFIRHQDAQGEFSYRYEPFSSRIDKGGYSMPRHAGATLALYRIYHHLRDPRYAKAADLALGYLKQRIITAPQGRAVAEDGMVKLGTVAITALALTERRAAIDTQEDPLLRDLLSFIAFMQKKDGSFCHMFYPPKRRDEVYLGQNFSGQALWALVRGIKIFGAYTNEFVKGMTIQAEGFWDFFLSRYYMFPFTWEMQAISEAEGLVADAQLKRWMPFLYDCADSMTDFLYDSDWPFPDYRGGYGTPEWFVPLAHAAGFQCEGLTGAYQMAKRDDSSRARAYRKALRETARFVLSQQVTAPTAMFYRDKTLPLGAFRAGPADHRQQIDFTQHIIAALINMLEQGVFDGAGE